jgi:dipeptidyl aminopeptidase/acylaminoacyl peptidase
LRILVLATGGTLLVNVGGCVPSDDADKAGSRTATVSTQPKTTTTPETVPQERLTGLILFWRSSPWPSIWAVRPDGSRFRRVYHTRQNAKRPRLSSDRKWIAFDGAAPGKPPLTDFDVQTVHVDGSRRRTLAGTRQYEMDAQWSPDGRRLSYHSYPHEGEDDDWLRASIWTVAASGGDRLLLGLGHGARWSPDGRQLFFSAPTETSDGDLFVMNADGTGRRLLLASPELEMSADWSPDGKELLFTRFDGSGADVMVMAADGTNVRTLTGSRGFDIAGAWSPDGTKILFTGGRAGGASELLLMDADGSKVHDVGGHRGSEPSWR